MRVFLLRVLVGWWAIPGIWATGFPFYWLLTGDTRESLSLLEGIAKSLWYGVE